MRHLISLTVCLALAAAAGALAWLVDDSSQSWASVPPLVVLALLAFAVQWLAFVPAFVAQTEHYYDLTGSATYASVVILALLLGPAHPRACLLGLLIGIWFCRLGSFLFRRIKRDGKDGRFDAIKPNFGKFLLAWTLQGLWVFLTLLAALIAMLNPLEASLDAWALIGALIWLIGFSIEAIADAQKSAFKQAPGSRDQFIQSGLWAWSRHPNYFGEILLWSGICVIAWPSFSGWSYAGLISPLFVAWLLIKFSGIPLLEQRADQRWGGQDDYERYKANTPVLLPRPPRS